MTVDTALYLRIGALEARVAQLEAMHSPVPHRQPHVGPRGDVPFPRGAPLTHDPKGEPLGSCPMCGLYDGQTCARQQCYRNPWSRGS